MAQKNGSEVRSMYIKDFPSRESGELFFEFWREFTNIHFLWKNYSTLFGHSPERISLLNKTAPSFFYMLQHQLLNIIVLYIARLFDSENIGGNINASFLELLNELKTFFSEEDFLKFSNDLNSLKKKCEKAITIRHKKIGHRDLAVLLYHKQDKVYSVSRNYINDALEKIGDFLNNIDLHFRKQSVNYELLFSTGDAESLIIYLKEAVNSFELKKRMRLTPK